MMIDGRWRFCALAGLLTALAGCSSNTELSGSSGGPANAAVAAQSLDARQVLADSLADAKSSNKRVFVHIGTPW